MDKNKRYNVGQVLYIVPKNENKVLPVLVVEEITKKTINGVEVTYKIQSGVDRSKVYLIDNIDGTFFTSPEVAKRSLTEFAAARIAKIVDLASRRAREWYPEAPQAVQQPSFLDDEVNDPSIVATELPEDLTVAQSVGKVTLEDGTVANIKISPPKQQ